jgi:hypothetical protein
LWGDGDRERREEEQEEQKHKKKKNRRRSASEEEVVIPAKAGIYFDSAPTAGQDGIPLVTRVHLSRWTLPNLRTEMS